MTRIRATRILGRLAAAAIACAMASAARADPILITIDDLPIVAAEYFTVDEQLAIMASVLQTLDAHHATAIVFANADKLEPHHEQMMDEFVRRGHVVGSHTFSHPSPNRMSVEDYERDILLNDEALARWMTGPKYFRFPFLETGPTREARDEIARFLREHGYRVVQVTVDSDDWSFNTTYTQALKAGDEEQARRAAEEYPPFVVNAGAAARSLATEKLGHPIHHVLLLHLNKLNAVMLDRVLTALEEDGWTFAGIDETLADPVYALEDEYFGQAGLIWLDRVLR